MSSAPPLDPSPGAKRVIDAGDILPYADYVKIRAEQRRRISAIKRSRRMEVGPFTTFYFENYDTMWHQVQEMLYIERGGDEQLADELAAYNPLIPQGSELIATVMIEIDDPLRRHNTLRQLGGIEHHMILSVQGSVIHAEPDPTRENTSPDGKASSVQFVRFPLADDLKRRFAAADGTILIGFDHLNYGHLAVMPPAVRQALAGDLAL